MHLHMHEYETLYETNEIPVIYPMFRKTNEEEGFYGFQFNCPVKHQYAYTHPLQIFKRIFK